VRIELTGKGFAVRPDGPLPSVTDRHEPIFTDVFEESRSISIILSYEAHTIIIRSTLFQSCRTDMFRKCRNNGILACLRSIVQRLSTLFAGVRPRVLVANCCPPHRLSPKDGINLVQRCTIGSNSIQFPAQIGSQSAHLQFQDPLSTLVATTHSGGIKVANS
jgi:hypothetical protein